MPDPGVNMPVVYEWRIPYAEKINVDSIIEVCDWAKKYSVERRLDKDVNDPLYRSDVGFYQIRSIYDSRKPTLYNGDELSEAIGSFVFHSIASVEMMDIARKFDMVIIEKYGITSFTDLFMVSGRVGNNADRFLYEYSKFKRQMLYYCMSRKNRLNPKELVDSLINSVRLMIGMNCYRNWNLVKGLALCMSKLQSRELNQH